MAALANITGNPARIIYVHGTIDGNVDDTNNPLVCTDYYRNGYTLEGYLANPTGMEAARAASATIQRGRMRLDVRSNTTIVGVGTNARLKGINLRIPGVTNVIIRNLTFEDAYDCFPAWDPTDGALGNWNSAYDNITITNGSGLFSSRIWVDHNAFTDGDHPDSTQPLYFGRPFQWHDGECDINNGSDLVTVSWNRFTDHDKTMLIGGSDGAGATDRNHLKVTIHHNCFANAGQRTPRDRFGQLHVYNNYYEVLNAPSSGFIPSYQYSWGVGIESAIWAQNNAFRMRGVTPDQIIRRFVGTKIGVSGTVINAPDNAVDVLAAYNAVNTPPLLPDPGWTPTLFTSMDPAAQRARPRDLRRGRRHAQRLDPVRRPRLRRGRGGDPYRRARIQRRGRRQRRRGRGRARPRLRVAEPAGGHHMPLIATVSRTLPVATARAPSRRNGRPPS